MDGPFEETTLDNVEPFPARRRNLDSPKEANESGDASEAEDEELEDEPIDLSKSLTSFAPFMKLPAELRLKIWRFAVPRARVIEVEHMITNRISVTTLEDGVDVVRTSTREMLNCSPVSVPTIFHICRESRAEALKMYQLGFEYQIDGVLDNDVELNAFVESSGLQKAYWNPEIDTIYFFDDPRHLSFAYPEGFNTLNLLSPSLGHMLHKIQSLAIPVRVDGNLDPDGEDLGYPFFRIDYWKSALDACSNLKNLYLVVENGLWVNPAKQNVRRVTVLYEPLDVPVEDFGGMTPFEVEEKLAGCFAGYRDDERPGWNPPKVSMRVAVRKRWKQSSWCAS